MTRFKPLAIYLVASVLVATVMSARADAPAKKPAPKLASWVHVFGCPTTTEHPKRIGQQDLVLVFDDGEIVNINISKLTEEKVDDLRAFVGDVKGITLVAKCEIAT